MPLLADVLFQGLILVDQPPAPTPEVTAQRWTTAVGNYGAGMVLLNPGSAAAAVASGSSAFYSAFLPILQVPDPGAMLIFPTGLQAALTAFWLAACTPQNLLPPVTAIIPNPVPLAPLFWPLVPVGMADQTPNGAVVRRQMATIIDAWTHLFMGVVPDAPPVPFA